MDITLDIAALLGWIISILTIAISINTILHYKRERDEAVKKTGINEEKNNAQQADILEAISTMNQNVCLLYEIIIPILESEKVNLEGLSGQKLNGNVVEAMKKIDEAKKKVLLRMAQNMKDATP